MCVNVQGHWLLIGGPYNNLMFFYYECLKLKIHAILNFKDIDYPLHFSQYFEMPYIYL